MYHIKPLSVVPEKIDLPKCMYNIKPVNGIQFSSLNGGLSPSIKRVKMEPALQAIEEKQLEVIAKLKNLKNTVDELIKNAGGAKSTTGGSAAKYTASNSVVSTSASSTSSCVLKNETIPNELVIEANPNRPPLSLIFISKSAVPVLRTLNHTHSSCQDQINQKLKSLFDRETESACSTVRLIWKNISGSRLTPETLGSRGVEGESNVARYLSRILPTSGSSLNYDELSLDDLVHVDNVLDSSEQVDTAPDQFLQYLQTYIQKRGNAPRTIADYVGYSTLQYLTKKQNKSQQSLQKSVNEWMNCLTNEVPALG